MAKKYGRIAGRGGRDRLTALLLACAMVACSWTVSVHAERDGSSLSGAERTSAESGAEASSAVSGGSEPAAASDGESGAQSAAGSSAPEVSSGETASSEGRASSGETVSSEAHAPYELKQQKLAAAVYADEKLETKSDDKTAITVEGSLPAGAAVKAYPVRVKLGGAAVLAAYDITVYGPDGAAYQPEKPVRVSISAPKLKDAPSVDVYHVQDAPAGEDEAAAGASVASEPRDDGGNGAPVEQATVEQNGSEKAMKATKVAGGVKPESETVEFQAEGFSIYVVMDNNGIQIVNGGSYSIAVGETITLVDTKIGGSWSTSDSNVIQLSSTEQSYVVTVKGLKPSSATVTYTRRNGKTETVTIRVGAAALHPVSTVDSWAQGVELYMFDYGGGSGSFSILNPGGNFVSKEGYGDGTTKEGLLQRVVGSNGFPITTTAQPMSQWFTESGSQVQGETYQPANNLFLKSYFDKNRTFHYSSAENFAALNGNTAGGVKDFTVYDELGTPSSDDQRYYQRGNFLPYNTIEELTPSGNTNNYDLEGNELPDGASKKGVPLYLMDQTVDFHFGMYMKADFIQPKSGLVPVDKNDSSQGTEPMKFAFTGDDDMWIYIDGVLVLDIGGIHDAQSGTIDFQTGEVTWTDTQTNMGKVSKTTSLKQMLDAAQIPQRTDSEGNITYTVRKFNEDGTAIKRDIVLKMTADGHYVYADYSKHTIQMFYMERGAGASNLKMNFNLPTIPKDSVSVSKKVEGLNPYWANGKEYQMKFFVEGEDGTYSVQRNRSYKIKDDNSPGETTGTTDENGTFSLKDGQTAVFSDIDENRKYYVQEVGPAGDISYQTQFNGQVKIFTNGIAQSDAVRVDENPQMTVVNTAQGTGSLRVTKKLLDYTDTEHPFNATFELHKVEDSETPVIQAVSYQADFKETDASGNKYYDFTGLLPGTYYIVETVLSSLNGKLPITTYTVGSGSPQNTGNGATALVTANNGNNIPNILVTNNYLKEYTLPVTGGAGNLPFRVAGAAILAGAAVGLGFRLRRGKKKKGGPPQNSP